MCHLAKSRHEEVPLNFWSQHDRAIFSASGRVRDKGWGTWHQLLRLIVPGECVDEEGECLWTESLVVVVTYGWLVSQFHILLWCGIERRKKIKHQITNQMISTSQSGIYTCACFRAFTGFRSVLHDLIFHPAIHLPTLEHSLTLTHVHTHPHAHLAHFSKASDFGSISLYPT